MMSKSDIQNEKNIQTLVHTFYDKIREDERLGYIFNDFAKVDWDHHLPRMVEFWSNILFQTGRYNGKPFRQHMPLPIEKQNFGRWFGLFESTVDELFEGEKADRAKEMAFRIASSFFIRMEMNGKFD